tara:strand:+ start:66 stop:602 length:537 start_codon:yes stop_codon:yes gene_type:complete
MKKLNIFLLSILISLSGFSQSKEETENWINQNINDFPVSYGDNSINVKEDIYLENGYVYFYHHWESNDDSYYSGSWDKVSLKDIKSIEYSYDKSPNLDNRWIEIHFNFDKGKCYTAELKNGFQTKENVSYSLKPERTAIIKRSNMDFVNSGIKNRMEKALIHIIKQYGGNAVIKKEPF